MWRIANDYDRLAKLAEEQLAAQENRTIERAPWESPRLGQDCATEGFQRQFSHDDWLPMGEA